MRKITLLFVSLSLILGLMGCDKLTATDKVRDLEFTIVEEGEIPEEFRTLIEEKKQGEFRLTYNDDKFLYIATGFGTKPTGGYSIQVKELYLTENSIYIDTELLGPEKKETAGTQPSQPYIVVKIEARGEPVVFR